MIEIKAGPELDRAVAEAIGEAYAAEAPEGFVGIWDKWGPDLLRYSTDLTAAFSAAEKVGLFEDYQLRKYRAVERRWDMIQKDNDWHTTPQAPTPALAICAAILILKGE